MNADDRIRLRHMSDAAREAIAFARGNTREDLTRDRKLQLSLVKEIEIVGEAADRGLGWSAGGDARGSLG